MHSVAFVAFFLQTWVKALYVVSERKRKKKLKKSGGDGGVGIETTPLLLFQPEPQPFLHYQGSGELGLSLVLT